MANFGSEAPEEYKRNELFIPHPRCYFCCLIPLCRLVDKILILRNWSIKNTHRRLPLKISRRPDMCGRRRHQRLRCQGYRQFMTSTKFQLGQVKNKTKQKFLVPVCFSFWGRLSFSFVISNVQQKPTASTLYPVLLNLVQTKLYKYKRDGFFLRFNSNSG